MKVKDNSKQPEYTNTCNQCHKEMSHYVALMPIHNVCINPECPNYALLQVSVENMARFYHE